jgi:hypothetical protein
MRVYHFALLFLIFFLAIIIKTDLNIGKMEAVEKEKMEMTESLDSATSDAINFLAVSDKFGTNAINRDEVVNTFLTSLYSSMGIISDEDAKTEVELYIPIILLCDTDGFYLYYHNDYKDPFGNTYTKRIWSEKVPYYYQDDEFIYRFNLTDMVTIYDIHNILPDDSENVIELNYHEIQTDNIYEDFRNNHGENFLLKDESFELIKKNAIISQIEDVLSYYTNKHNSIARQNGITYNFAFPAGKENEWAEYMDDVNLLIVFQGYPYGVDKDYTFNKIASAGANIIRRSDYYVEKKSWYYLAHKAGCVKLKESTTVLEETFESIEECAKIGAYCDDCIENSPRVPDLK